MEPQCRDGGQTGARRAGASWPGPAAGHGMGLQAAVATFPEGRVFVLLLHLYLKTQDPVGFVPRHYSFS